MKFWKHSLVAAFSFFGVASTVLISSCEQDSCLELNCRNGGTCADGFCRCMDGYEGTECEIVVSDLFLGFYKGNTNFNRNEPQFADSMIVYPVEDPNVIGFYRYGTAGGDSITGTIVDRRVEVIEGNRRIYLQKTGDQRIELYIENPGGSPQTITFTGTFTDSVKRAQ